MDNGLTRILRALLEPSKIWSRSEILTRPSPVPASGGIYAWYFRKMPAGVPISNSPECHGVRLLYVGISPAREGSLNNLRKRIRSHFNGNASSSTLRLTLGCLLSGELRLTLRPTGRTNHLTFGEGELILSNWLEKNAFVVWVPCSQPWVIERQIIHNISPLLNLAHNSTSSFHSQLSAIRRQSTSDARASTQH